MLNTALFRRELRKSRKLLLLFATIMTMYIALIISMYDPEMMAMLDGIVEMMPELMAAVGMKAGAQDLLSFMISYLYGFILLIFPMVFSVVRANGLIAGYVDRGSMAALLAAPVKRRTIAFTQMSVLVTGLVILLVYCTALELVCAEYFFPGVLSRRSLIALNCGLLHLHLFIGGIAFLASCACSESRWSLAVGGGIPALMYILQMLANVGSTGEKAKYFTFFTLFYPEGLVAREGLSMIGAASLLVGAIILYMVGIEIFSGRDLHI